MKSAYLFIIYSYRQLCVHLQVNALDILQLAGQGRYHLLKRLQKPCAQSQVTENTRYNNKRILCQTAKQFSETAERCSSTVTVVLQRLLTPEENCSWKQLRVSVIRYS